MRVRIPPFAPSSLHKLRQMKKSKTVHLVSLGCAKNLVDSQVMLGHLTMDGYEIVDDPSQAKLIVVNTCGFINPAKEESVNTILDMADYKNDGECETLIVSGCLSQRYAPDLAKTMPEVDHFLGLANFDQITQLLHDDEKKKSSKQNSATQIKTIWEESRKKVPDHPRLHGKNALIPYRHMDKSEGEAAVFIPDPDFLINADSPRLLSGDPWTTYLKVSEGCSNQCGFCVIPKIRGPQRSRTVEDIVREAEELMQKGVVELNLIAQDLCAYGKDIAGPNNLPSLLRALDKSASEAEGRRWLRMLYAYPRGLTQDVMKTMAEAENIVPYLDIPLQHISERILSAQKRGEGGKSTRDLIKKLRAEVPDIIIRTTFITGLPGESEEEFKELLDFVEESRFERLGVFPFSPEEDTPAARMHSQVPFELAEERAGRLMEIQQKISREQQEEMIGQEVEVLVDGISEESDLLLSGRHAGQAPEVDGIIYINDGEAAPGDIVKVIVDQAMDYDLVGGISS